MGGGRKSRRRDKYIVTDIVGEQVTLNAYDQLYSCRDPIRVPLVDSEGREARADGWGWNKCFLLWRVFCLAGRTQKSCQCKT